MIAVIALIVALGAVGLAVWGSLTSRKEAEIEKLENEVTSLRQALQAIGVTAEDNAISIGLVNRGMWANRQLIDELALPAIAEVSADLSNTVVAMDVADGVDVVDSSAQLAEQLLEWKFEHAETKTVKVGGPLERARIKLLDGADVLRVELHGEQITLPGVYDLNPDSQIVLTGLPSALETARVTLAAP